MARTLASTAAAPIVSVTRRAFAARRLAIVAAACLTLGMIGTSAHAQNLPFDVRAATITTTAPIADYVKTAVADLNSGDRDKVMAARQVLLAPLERNRGQSPAFLNAYAREVNDKLLAVANAKDPHAKLNAALVAIRAGEATRSPSLSPLIAKLATDDSPAVATFGLRAASQVLLNAVGNATAAANDPLIGAIAAAVQENPESDAVIFEAYQALTTPLLERDAARNFGQGVIDAATPKIVDAIQNLMEIRLKQYAAGDIVEPAAELQGITLITRSQTWAISTPAQRTRTVNLVAGILDGAATQLVAAQSGSVTSNRTRAEALRNTIKGAAGGLNVISQQAPANKPLGDATGSFKNFGSSTPAADYRAAADKAVAQALSAFPAADANTTSPTTQPQVP